MHPVEPLRDPPIHHHRNATLQAPCHTPSPQTPCICNPLPRCLPLALPVPATTIHPPPPTMKALQTNFLPGPLHLPLHLFIRTKLSRMPLHNIKQRIDLPSLQPDRLI